MSAREQIDRIAEPTSLAQVPLCRPRRCKTSLDNSKGPAPLTLAPSPAESSEDDCLTGDERQVKLARQEHVLGHEAPVDGPDVEEGAREVEGR